MVETRIKIGGKIKEFRIKRKLTQLQLAERSRITYKYVQQVEGKNPPNIRVDTVTRFAKALNEPEWKFWRWL